MRMRRFLSGFNGTWYGIGAVILWSSTFGLFRVSMESFGRFTAAGAVFMLAGALTLCLRLRGFGRSGAARTGRPDWTGVFLKGWCFVLYMLTLYGALGLTTSRGQVLTVSLINYLWPMFMLLWAIFVFGRSPRWLLFIPGALLALGGVAAAVIYGDSEAGSVEVSWTTGALALLAAMSWGMYSNLAQKCAATARLLELPLFMLVSGIALWSMRYVFAEPPPVWSWIGALSIVAQAVFPAGLAYVWWDKAMRGGNLTVVAAFSNLAPVLSVLCSSLLLRIVPGRGFFLGALAVSCGALLLRAAFGKARAAAVGR